MTWVVTDVDDADVGGQERARAMADPDGVELLLF